MLDLVGRIPTAAEARQYLADERLNKRELTGFQASQRGGLVFVRPSGERVSIALPPLVRRSSRTYSNDTGCHTYSAVQR